MAKGDVILKFDANTAEFVTKVMAAREALASAANSSRDFGAATVKAGDQADKDFGKSAANLVKTLATIGAAVTLTKEIWSASLSDMAKRSDALRQAMEKLEDVLGRHGKQDILPQVRAQLEKDSGGRVTRAESEEIYSKIYDSLGDKASPADVRKAYQASMKGLDAGLSQDSAAMMGKTFGELSTQPALKKLGLNDDQMLEVAGALQRQKPEGLDEKEWRNIQRSKDPIAALDLVLTAQRSHETARQLGSLQEGASEEYDPVKVAELQKKQRRNPKRLTAEEDRYLRNAQIDPDDRFNAWMEDPTLAPPNSRTMIENLKSSRAPIIEDVIKNGPVAKGISDMARLRATDPESKAVYELQRTRVANDTEEQKDAARAAHEEAVWQQIDTNLKQNGIRNSAIRGSMMWAARFFEGTGGYGTNTTTGENVHSPMYKDAERQVDSQFQVLRGIHDGIQSLNKHAAKQNSVLTTRRDTTLSNDNEGQK